MKRLLTALITTLAITLSAGTALAEAFIYSPIGFRSYTAWYVQLPSGAQQVEDYIKQLENNFYYQHGHFIPISDHQTVNAILQQIPSRLQPFAYSRLEAYWEHSDALSDAERTVEDIDQMLQRMGL